VNTVKQKKKKKKVDTESPDMECLENKHACRANKAKTQGTRNRNTEAQSQWDVKGTSCITAVKQKELLLPDNRYTREAMISRMGFQP
jgi:hypothetical protein